MFWLRIAKIMSPLIKENSYIIYIGKHTFAIMMHHLFAVFLIQGFVGIMYLKFGFFPTFRFLYKGIIIKHNKNRASLH